MNSVCLLDNFSQVVPQVNDDTSITLSLSYPEDEHVAVNFLKLSSFCQSETFERKVIDLKNRDGVVATCDVRFRALLKSLGSDDFESIKRTRQLFKW